MMVLYISPKGTCFKISSTAEGRWLVVPVDLSPASARRTIPGTPSQSELGKGGEIVCLYFWNPRRRVVGFWRYGIVSGR